MTETPCYSCGVVHHRWPCPTKDHNGNPLPPRRRSTWNDAMSDSPTPSDVIESGDLEARDE